MKFNNPSMGNTNNNSQDIPQEAWDQWNTYYWGLFGKEESPTKKSDGSVVENNFTKKLTKIGLANFFLDVGHQPQPDSSYDSKLPKGTEDGQKGHGVENMPAGYSDEEKAHVTKYPDNYFKTVDGKRVQFKPEKPTQEVYIAFDIPEIMVDWTKYPRDNLHKLGCKPLRLSFNGYFCRKDKDKNIVWEGFGKSLRFNPNYRTKKLSPNNPINKLAANMSLGLEFENSEYDFDVLLGGATNVTFTINCSKEGESIKSVYSPNFKASSEIIDMNVPNIGLITREQQIPSCDIVPVSVMLDQESFDDNILEIIRNKKELKAVLPKATSYQPSPINHPDFWLGKNWKETALCKALESSSEGGNTPAKQDPAPKSAPVEQKQGPAPKQADTTGTTNNEPPMDFDDDIPF